MYNRPLPSEEGRLIIDHTKGKIILLPKAVIRLASATDRELWLGLQQELLKTRTSGFLCILRILKK